MFRVETTVIRHYFAVSNYDVLYQHIVLVWGEAPFSEGSE
jgi:hypothetical protein